MKETKLKKLPPLFELTFMRWLYLCYLRIAISFICNLKLTSHNQHYILRYKNIIIIKVNTK